MKTIITHTNRIRICLAMLLGIAFQTAFSQDVTAPDTPVIDSVTVLWQAPINSSGDVLITWQACDSIDVRSYYIKYLDEVIGTYKFLDSVDANTTTYLDSKPITDPHYPQTYVVQAVDYSNNASNHSDQHQTVRVFPWQKDENCDPKVELSWNAYQGWEEGIDYFDLYTVYQGTDHYLGRFNPGELEYIYALNALNIDYEFYARVKSLNGRSSTSNKIPFTPDIPKLPDYIDAEYVSVENEQVILKFVLDSTADINNYELARSSDTLASFQKIMEFDNFGQKYLPITDASADVDKQQYFYKLYLYNDCQTVLDSSRTLSSIFLKGSANSGSYEQYLEWSSYFDSELYEKEYQLLRYTESELNIPRTIFETQSSFEYTDDLKDQDFRSFVGDFCYYIQGYDSKSGYTARSNKICLAQKPSLSMPNAFTPNGFIENRIFKPTYAFIAAKPYYFAIFDRWGLKVFETYDYKEGWDGKENGFTYPNGIYSYYLEYFSSKGEKFTETGTFNLIN